jgi:hypothetical protein
MPAVSLVICVYKERELLERLLYKVVDCYDDLVVVHDGAETNTAATSPRIEEPPKEMAFDYSKTEADSPIPSFYKTSLVPLRSSSIRDLVLERGGRYFEGPRCYQQEPHWPFSWQQARHNWILRLDADEFPSEELKTWLRTFRYLPEPCAEISGYTCIWPLWNGRRAITRLWPRDRIFLFDRRHVRFFGMVEQVPIPDASYQPLNFILNHQPMRKSYGVVNILFRKQAYRWRRVIARSLLKKVTELPCWRWTCPDWPSSWRRIYDHPLKYAIKSMLLFPLRQCAAMLKARETPRLSACLNPALHHFMLGLQVMEEKRKLQMDQ